MNILGLSPRDRIALRFGAVVVVAILVLFRIAPWWKAWRSTARGWAVDAVGQLAVRNAALENLPSAIDSAEARVERVLGLGGTVLAAGTDDEASTRLASIVEEAARLSAVDLQEVEVAVENNPETVLRRVTAHVHGRGDGTGLGQFVLALEAGPALLAIRSLAIRSQGLPVPATEPEDLSLEMSVEGLAIVRAQEPGGAP